MKSKDLHEYMTKRKKERRKLGKKKGKKRKKCS